MSVKLHYVSCDKFGYTIALDKVIAVSDIASFNDKQNNVKYYQFTINVSSDHLYFCYLNEADAIMQRAKLIDVMSDPHKFVQDIPNVN